jgi:murein DD-endopeptidase MepM/ murein hydrolase activator NlpD
VPPAGVTICTETVAEGPPQLMLSTINVYQAGAILASVVGDVTSGSINFIGRNYTLTKGDHSMYAFIGVDAADPPGPEDVKVSFTTANGSKGTLDESVTVLQTKWDVDVDNLTFDPQTAKLLDPALVNAEEATLNAVYGKITPEKLWNGPWEMPVQGPITAHFGEQRSYQGGPPTGHHSGTDIGVDAGTPVHAANSGRVVLAQMLSERGNMVIIDHGGGLFSGYAHMSEFKVKVGDMVHTGDVIGLAGSTGLATGPHVHWEMSSDGVLLDALRFSDGSNGF